MAAPGGACSHQLPEDTLALLAAHPGERRLHSMTAHVQAVTPSTGHAHNITVQHGCRLQAEGFS